MKTVLVCLLFACALLCGGCASSPFSPSGLIPPYPRTKSVLPLGIGNTWMYSTTVYDSAGNNITPDNEPLRLAITGVFGLDNNNALVGLTRDNRDSVFPGYAYTYEWGGARAGLLVAHRGSDPYPPEQRGLYVVGSYAGDSITLYKKEYLFLSYPSVAGKQWAVSPDPADSSATADSFSTVSTAERFFVPDSCVLTGGTFYTCILYKETRGPLVCYYYYYPDIGCVGTLRYQNGVLRQSTILKSFTQGSN
jgi:hypothetical protein